MADHSQYAAPRACEKLHVPTATSARWFAVYTASRHEKVVLRSLLQKQIETFLPLYQAKRQWKKRGQVLLELPLFPNYLFVRVAHHMRGSVLGVPGVLSIVGAEGEPSPLSDHEVEAIRTGLRLQIVEPYSYLRVGERAQIKTGPLAGMDGVVLRINDKKLRIVLTVATLMQSFAAEVNAEDVDRW